MSMRIHLRESGGTITVFLSLVLLLILSLLLTVIEGARVATAKVCAARALTTAMDSVLAEYYGPLWEEYHIFGYYEESQGDKSAKEQIIDKLADTMSFTFTPQKALNKSVTKDSIELYNINLDKINVTNRTFLTEYSGKLLIYEAVEYMKYEKIGDGVEALLNKLSLLETPDKVAYLMDEKMKVDEELAGIDLGILELMELLDGINTSKKGLELNSKGELTSKPIFVKKICQQEVTMENVGLNHESIFQMQKPNYTNPIHFFSKIHTELIEINSIVSQMQSLRDDCQTEGEKLTKEKEALSALEAKEKKTITDKRKIIEYRNTMKQRISNIQILQSSLKEKETNLSQRISSVESTNKEITQLINEVKPYIKKAIVSIDKILLKVEKVAPLISQYEELLNSEMNNLSVEVYEGLEDGLSEIKRYLPDNNTSYDFKSMKEILEKDLTILVETENSLNQADQLMQSFSYTDAKTYFKQAEEKLSAYRISGLTLDYSTLVLDKTGIKSPMKEMGNLLQGSILNLILAPGKISGQRIKAVGLLPSEQAALQKDDKDNISSITALFNSGEAGMDNLKLGNLFGSIEESSQLSTILFNGVNKAAEIILFQEYLNEHFGSYQALENNSQYAKPSVLAYEKEYVLVGKESDKDNLASIVTQIIALRTIFDFVSILGDSAKREEAKLVAAALVGFTGLPFLISITQTLILIVWSFAEALLDTCALMAGKNVPILKNKIILELPELFLLNREYLQQKTSKIVDTQQLSLTYQGYLQVFLLLKDKGKLVLRSMDLIQENIRLRYKADNFSLDECIFGYEVHSEYVMKSKFIGVSFVQQYLGHHSDNFMFSVNSAYSY